jgi:uncharacterized protein (TIGR02266 family)
MDPMPIVVPVRFSGGGLTMQTTTSRMSFDTLFVRCLVAPRQAADVTLELKLPDDAKPVRIKGTITETIAIGNKGKEAGFWVHFATEPRLDAFLRQKAGLAPAAAPAAPAPARAPNAAPAASAPAPSAAPVAPSPPETRVFPRLSSRFKVSWNSPRDFLVTYSENISSGGIFVATEAPVALREVVELSLELPDGQGPAKTYAEVVQRITPEQAKAKGRVAGAGLQFIGSDDEFRKRLDACLENLLK